MTKASAVTIYIPENVSQLNFPSVLLVNRKSNQDTSLSSLFYLTTFEPPGNVGGWNFELFTEAGMGGSRACIVHYLLPQTHRERPQFGWVPRGQESKQSLLYILLSRRATCFESPNKLGEMETQPLFLQE